MTTTTKTFYRTLGRSGLQVSAMGLGCWAIGGIWYWLDGPGGWGDIDDNESVRAIQRALDLGINFFDTAANYGTGHSERILARAGGRVHGDDRARGAAADHRHSEQRARR